MFLYLILPVVVKSPKAKDFCGSENVFVLSEGG